MKSYKDKQLLLGLLFLGLGAGILGRGFENIHFTFPGTSDLGQAAAILATQQNIEPHTVAQPDITLGFAGDVTLDEAIKTNISKNFGGNYAALFANAEFLSAPDVTFAALGNSATGPKLTAALVNSGVDVVSATTDDADTITALRASGIATCGVGMNKTDAETPAIFTRGGSTVGFLCVRVPAIAGIAATDAKPGILFASDPEFASIVKKDSAEADALVVAFDWGIGGKKATVADQIAFAQTAINSGATMVVNTGDSPSSDTASYGGVPIISVGNLISDPASLSASATQPLNQFFTATFSSKNISNILPHELVQEANFAPTAGK